MRSFLNECPWLTHVVARKSIINPLTGRNKLSIYKLFKRADETFFASKAVPLSVCVRPWPIAARAIQCKITSVYSDLLLFGGNHIRGARCWILLWHGNLTSANLPCCLTVTVIETLPMICLRWELFLIFCVVAAAPLLVVN